MHIDELAQHCDIQSELAMELPQPCIETIDIVFSLDYPFNIWAIHGQQNLLQLNNKNVLHHNWNLRENLA